NELVLFFPERGACYLHCITKTKTVRSTSQFMNQYNIPVGFVPILGPVEHEEPLYQRDAARLALLTHRAARNFRNIWHHYPDNFDEFRNLVKALAWIFKNQKSIIQLKRLFCICSVRKKESLARFSGRVLGSRSGVRC